MKKLGLDKKDLNVGGNKIMIVDRRLKMKKINKVVKKNKSFY